jgi:uncharacterized protein DUF3108
MSTGPRSLSRRWGLAVLAIVLLLAHGWLMSWFNETRLGWGAQDKPPPRLQAAFVRELEPTAPPAPAPPPRPVARRSKPKPAPAPQPAASAPAEEPVVAEAPAASEPAPVASAPEPAASVAIAAEAPASSASQPQAFEWPPSTRLSYRLTGRYRGPLEGYAKVQWIRLGTHYQVHLDVTANLMFTREMTSDGELTEQGLAPKRYDEETRVGPLEPRRATLRFEPEHVVMPDGSARPTLPGVQDTASQLVQLTWLFTTQPERLRPGSSVEMPLALPRRIDMWVYDVLEAEVVETPFGMVDTFHVKPRRPDKPVNVLTIEAWIAPGLQYLPVRLRINQDADAFVELVIERKPQQSDK